MDTKDEAQESFTREDFRKEIEGYLTQLEGASEFVQDAVCYNLARASGLFFATFGSLEQFMEMSDEDQVAYVEEVGRFEDEHQERDNYATFAFGLFKMWLGTVIEDDRELMILFLDRLGPFMNWGEKLLLGFLEDERRRGDGQVGDGWEGGEGDARGKLH